MILTPDPKRRVFAYPAPVDLRKGYDGLFGLVEQGLKCDPMCGDLYLFVNEPRKLCKILVWDGTGLCIFAEAPDAWHVREAVARRRQDGAALAARARDVRRGLDIFRAPGSCCDRRAEICCFGSRVVI